MFHFSLTEQDQTVSSQSAGWGSSGYQNLEWTKVAAGDTVPFTFEGPGRGKQRHRDTHTLKAHQLLVQVDGWDPIGPVTVDKVGVFFRLANPRTPPGYQDSSHITSQVSVTYVCTYEGYQGTWKCRKNWVDVII